MFKPAQPDLVIEWLGSRHKRSEFDCGVPELTNYLRRNARQEMDKDVAVPYVLVRTDNPEEIIGFYTLSSATIKLTDIPLDLQKRLPRYPDVPATLLGRMAVDVRYQRQPERHGEHLLIDALKRSLDASRKVASFAVILDAKNEGVVSFYARYGFKSLPEAPLRMFIPMKTVEETFEYPLPPSRV